MRSSLVMFFVVLAASSAFADEMTKPFTPRAGDMELRVTPSYLLGANDLQEGSSSGSLTVAGGFGYCLTNVVELGGTVGLSFTAPGTGASTAVVQIEPLVKFNFGSLLSPRSRLNPFIVTGIGLLDSNGTVFVAPTVNVGLEVMVTHTWGVVAYLPFEVLIGGDLTVGYGVGYGVVTYF